MGGVKSQKKTRGGRPRIVLAEDDAAIRRLVQKLLETFADVDAFADGMEAYSHMRHHGAPDLVVTDVMMPRMDGLTLANRLKHDEDLKVVPIIILTAKGGAKDMIAGINVGARHYVTKPFDRDEFLGKVKKTLGLT